jgi:hypothetical protein
LSPPTARMRTTRLQPSSIPLDGRQGIEERAWQTIRDRHCIHTHLSSDCPDSSIVLMAYEVCLRQSILRASRFNHR